MRLIILMIFAILLTNNICSAEIVSTRNLYNATINQSINEINTPSGFTVKSYLSGGKVSYISKDGSKYLSNDISFEIMFKLIPSNEELAKTIFPLRNDFHYEISGEGIDKVGSFTRCSDGFSSTYRTGKISVYGDNENGYEVFDHYKETYVPSSLEINYSSSSLGWKDDKTEKFIKDLIKCIKNKQELTLYVYYSNHMGSGDDLKQIQININKDIMEEWKVLSKID